MSTSSSTNCKLVRELCEKFQKFVSVVKEIQSESNNEIKLQKPEEIEMEVFWRKTYVRFTEPEEKWSVTRRRFVVPPPSRPIDIVYPPRVQDW